MTMMLSGFFSLKLFRGPRACIIQLHVVFVWKCLNIFFPACWEAMLMPRAMKAMSVETRWPTQGATLRLFF